MHSISIKGIVLGSLFDLVATFAFVFALGIFLSLFHGGDAEAAMLAACSAEWMTVSLVVTSAFTVIAGYLAARIAGRGELINGTLSAVLSTAIALLMSIGQPSPWPVAVNLFLFILTPLLGLLGGYLRSRQVKGG
jgi:hypothetical protein